MRRALLALVASGCALLAVSTAPATAQSTTPPIQHLVVILEENSTFDHTFGTLHGVDGRHVGTTGHAGGRRDGSAPGVLGPRTARLHGSQGGGGAQQWSDGSLDRIQPRSDGRLRARAERNRQERASVVHAYRSCDARAVAQAREAGRGVRPLFLLVPGWVAAKHAEPGRGRRVRPRPGLERRLHESVAQRHPHGVRRGDGRRRLVEVLRGRARADRRVEGRRRLLRGVGGRHAERAVLGADPVDGAILDRSGALAERPVAGRSVRRRRLGVAAGDHLRAAAADHA